MRLGEVQFGEVRAGQVVGEVRWGEGEMVVVEVHRARSRSVQCTQDNIKHQISNSKLRRDCRGHSVSRCRRSHGAP